MTPIPLVYLCPRHKHIITSARATVCPVSGCGHSLNKGKTANLPGYLQHLVKATRNRRENERQRARLKRPEPVQPETQDWQAIRGAIGRVAEKGAG